MVHIYFSTPYFCLMLINELSKKTGISVHTIRFYEKSGLIEGKRDESVHSNNYFHYDEVTVEKLEFISDAKSVGFTIKEIAHLMCIRWFTVNDHIKSIYKKLNVSSRAEAAVLATKYGLV